MQIALSRPVPSKREIVKKKREALRDNAILVPVYLWFSLVITLPTIMGYILSFTEWNGLAGLPVFVGLKNYLTFFGSKGYMSSLYKTVIIGGLTFVLTFVLSFFMGLSLNMPFKGRGIFRTVLYLPSVITVTVSSSVLLALIVTVSGVINNALKTMGLQPVIWSYSAFWKTFRIVAYTVWKGVGFNALIWLGGLQSIQPQLYEAARIDGANRLQELLFITLPGLRSYTSYIAIIGLIYSMQIFDAVFLISRGGPQGATDVIMYKIYNDGRIGFNFGMAGASSLIVGTVIILITLVSMKISDGREAK